MDKERIHTISAESFARKYQKGMLKHALLLDVREQAEWERYHLDGTLLMPLSTIAYGCEKLDPKQEIYVFCAHGVRSLYVVNYLLTCGFQWVINVEGGLAKVGLYLDGDWEGK